MKNMATALVQHDCSNAFQQYFGDFPSPIIRADQYRLLPHDTAQSLSELGLGISWYAEEIRILAGTEHTQYSQVNNDLDFVGPSNRRRFPEFVSFDFRVVHSPQAHLLKRDRTVRVDIRMFSATGHFNTQDVINDIP